MDAPHHLTRSTARRVCSRETFGSSTNGLTVSGDAQAIIPPDGDENMSSPTRSNPRSAFPRSAHFGSAVRTRAAHRPTIRKLTTIGFQVTALFDEARHELLYRKNGGSWQPWQGTLPVAWTTSLQFNLRSLTNGTRGPIHIPPIHPLHRRPRGSGLGQRRRPRLRRGLLSGSIPSPGPIAMATAFPISTKSSKAPIPRLPWNIRRTPTTSPRRQSQHRGHRPHHGGTEIALNEEIEARALDGTAARPCARQDRSRPVLPDGGSRGALPPRFLHRALRGTRFALQSPLYYHIIGGLRSGRETIGFIPADPPPVFAPAFVPNRCRPDRMTPRLGQPPRSLPCRIIRLPTHAASSPRPTVPPLYC
jgi:hypothetical protein